MLISAAGCGSWIDQAAGAQVLYQRRGNQDYYVLDPDTRRERLLLAGNTLGWTFSPAVSPDGRRIALAWNRPNESGIWVMSSEGAGGRLVHRSDSLPTLAGWSADGTAVFAVFGERPTHGLPFSVTASDRGGIPR